MTKVSRSRQDALKIFEAGVAAADPYLAVKRCLQTEGIETLAPEGATVHLIAFGKAACAMAKAAVEIINLPELDLINPPQPPFSKGGICILNSDRLGQTIVVTNYENVTALENVEVIGAGHPLPDAQGLQAAKRIADLLVHTKADDLVLVLISGGGSALIPYPVNGISLEEKIATTDLLLASGASIQQINCVRKHLSKLKGGSLAKLAYPAHLHALILSDVIGDDLSSIASGPTVADNTTYSDAIHVLKSAGVWDKVPDSVKRHLQSGKQGLIPETPKADNPVFKNTRHTLVGSNTISVHATEQAAQALGYETHLIPAPVCGYAREEAERLVQSAKAIKDQGIDKPVAILSGGETTVKLKGTGLGGRNQEMALSFACAAKEHRFTGQWTFLSGGTDGRDGPTDAAGGMVDQHSYQTMVDRGLNPEALLENNDSYHALAGSNDLLMTGATGTNVADLQVLLLYPEN